MQVIWPWHAFWGNTHLFTAHVFKHVYSPFSCDSNSLTLQGSACGLEKTSPDLADGRQDGSVAIRMIMQFSTAFVFSSLICTGNIRSSFSTSRWQWGSPCAQLVVWLPLRAECPRWCLVCDGFHWRSWIWLFSVTLHSSRESLLLSCSNHLISCRKHKGSQFKRSTEGAFFRPYMGLPVFKET